MRIITRVLLAGISSIAIAPHSASASSKYDALCSAGGGFDRCGVQLETDEAVFISIDGFNEMNYCLPHTLEYRSNPASPYRKVQGDLKNLTAVVKAESGIDHDFLFRYVEDENSTRRKNLVVRFKNHSVAVRFSKELTSKLTSVVGCNQ